MAQPLSMKAGTLRRELGRLPLEVRRLPREAGRPRSRLSGSGASPGGSARG